MCASRSPLKKREEEEEERRRRRRRLNRQTLPESPRDEKAINHSYSSMQQLMTPTPPPFVAATVGDIITNPRPLPYGARTDTCPFQGYEGCHQQAEAKGRYATTRSVEFAMVTLWSDGVDFGIVWHKSGL